MSERVVTRLRRKLGEAMSGKHVAEDGQCDAICKGTLAERWGYVAGSRCTGKKGHPTPRNGVGHYFPKRGGWRG